MISRKIWSLPLVLVTALLLVGLFAASVLAQGTPSAPASVASSVDGADVGATTDLAVIPLENLPTDAALVPAITANPQADPPIVGFVNPKIIGGPMYDGGDDGNVDDPLFTIETGNSDGDDPDPNVSVRLVSGADAADLTQSSYSFTVELVYDLDDQNDGDADEDTIATNDREATLRTAVNIYVLRVSQDVDFDIEAGGIVVGATISALGRDIDDNAQNFAVTGVAPNATISGMELAAAGGGDADDVFELFGMGGNKLGLKVKALDDSPVAADASYEFTGTVHIDTDTAEDAADDDSDATTWDNDGNTSNDRDVALAIAQNDINVHAALAIMDQTPPAENADDDGFVAMRSIRDDISDDHLIHTIVVTGGATGEDVDGVVSGDSRFGIDDSLSIKFTGGTLAEGEEIELLVIANGDTGIANRTTSGKVRIMVTGSNAATFGR